MLHHQGLKVDMYRLQTEDSRLERHIHKFENMNLVPNEMFGKKRLLQSSKQFGELMRELEWTDSSAHNLVWQALPATIQRQERQENEVRMPKLLLQPATARRLSCEKLVASGPKNVAGPDCDECCFCQINSKFTCLHSSSCGRPCKAFVF